jgi:hypothetical protein
VVRDRSLGAGAPHTPAGAVKLLGFREKVWLGVLAALSGLEEVCKMLKRNMLRMSAEPAPACSQGLVLEGLIETFYAVL